MIDKKFQRFIKEQNDHLYTLYPGPRNSEKGNFAQMLKLTEEVGELSEAVLAYYGKQRKSKQGKDINLEKEVADVLITTLILADDMNLDINEVLEARVDAIKQRRKTD